MAQLSRYLRSVGGGGLAFWCQGCREAHTIWVGEGPGPRWAWNGDVEKPVVSPSLLVTGRRLTAKGHAQWVAWHAAGCPDPAPDLDAADVRCHTFVGCQGALPGEIVFLGDCTHDMVGKVLPLAELPPHMCTDT